MRELTIEELSCVVGGYDLTDSVFGGDDINNFDDFMGYLNKHRKRPRKTTAPCKPPKNYLSGDGNCALGFGRQTVQATVTKNADGSVEVSASGNLPWGSLGGLFHGGISSSNSVSVSFVFCISNGTAACQPPGYDFGNDDWGLDDGYDY